MNTYFKLDMPEMWWIGPAQIWIQMMVAENKICSLCHRVLRGWFPTPFDVRYDRPIDPPYIHDSSVTNIALIDRRLLERLLTYSDPTQWAIGRALDKMGDEVVTHATCYMQTVVEKRSGIPQNIKVCVECGTIRVRPQNPYDDEYLLSYDVAERAVVMDRIGMIYIRQDVMDSLDLTDLKPMFPTPIPVLNDPKDGLRYPGDPPTVRGVDATEPWDPKVDPVWDKLPIIGG